MLLGEFQNYLSTLFTVDLIKRFSLKLKKGNCISYFKSNVKEDICQ